MNKLILVSAAAVLVTMNSSVFAACNADIQMNEFAPTNEEGNTITNVPLPTDGTDVATKAYVDQYGRIVAVSSEQTAVNFPNAAQGCSDLTEGGYTDWFIPSLEQLASGLPGLSDLNGGPYWTATAYQTDSSGENSLFVTYTPSTQAVGSEVSTNQSAFVCIR